MRCKILVGTGEDEDKTAKHLSDCLDNRFMGASDD